MLIPEVLAAFAVLAGGLTASESAPPSPAAPGGKAPGGPAPTVRLVTVFDVKDFGSETLRIGDLDSDGQPDLVFVQCVYETREITCATAADIHGKVLWQWGKPSAANGRLYSDLPVQVYDWDGDGRNEVLLVRQARYVDPPFRPGVPRERATRYEGSAALLVLGGLAGREEASLPLPAPADDSFLFADLTGRGRREDLVVKDRYWNMWGVSHEGKVLWRWTGSTGHYPAVADVDGDGRDEVFVGFALIDHNGKVLFSKDPKGAHQDACYLVRPADGRWRLLFGNEGIHCLAVDGSTLWHHPMGEAQHVVAGQFQKDSPLQFVVVDRTPVATHRRDANAWAILYLYDLAGKELWRRQQEKGAWAIAPLAVDWLGAESPQAILVYGHGPGRPAELIDGRGNVFARLPMEYAPDRTAEDRKADFYALAADVWGDGREEVILFGSRGACIYTNPRPAAVGSLYNENLYPGM